MTRIARLLLPLFAVLCCTIACAQQKVSEADWSKLMTALQKENWSSVEQMSATYLQRYNGLEDTTPATPTLRYMLLRSVAGQLAAKKYTPEQALGKVQNLKGQGVLTPTLTFRSKGMFNIVKLADNGKALFICGANNKATEIHTFEYYSPSDTAIMGSIGTALEEQPVRLYAIVTDIKTAGVTFPHLEVRLADTELFINKQ
jgi:hypothetical protein